MAQIRCSRCDTIHEVDAALLSAGPQRMRCASCRNVFEATALGANQSDAFELTSLEDISIEIDVRGLMAPAPLRTVSAPPAMEITPIEILPATELPVQEQAQEQEQAEPAPFDFDAVDIAADEAPDIFDAAPEPDAMPEQTDIDANEPLSEDPILVPDTPDPAEIAAERRRNRRNAETTTPVPPPASGLKAASSSIILMVCGVWALVTLGIFRNEITRIIPIAGPAFATLGLSVATSELNITELHSTVITHEGQEALEITGKLTNTTRGPLNVPVLRLSLRNTSGVEIYVWTSNFEKPELAADETFAFIRKLASPPPDASSVMVRFVAKDDIVSAIR